MAKRTKQTEQNIELSPAKRWLFRAIVWFFPVILLILIETILRLSGYGTDYRLFVTSSVDRRYLEPNPQLGRRYFPGGRFYPNVTHSFLLKEKPKNCFRIFVLGGSTARGYPYYYNGSFSSMLRVMLQKSYPALYFEVINLAMVAVNSYTVRDITRELWAYQPDLILIYSGHNEFYGALGVGSVEKLGTSRSLVLAYLYFNRFKTFQLVRNLIRSVRQQFGGKDTSTPLQTTLMEHLASRRSIPYGSPLYRKAVQIFRENLTDVVAMCQEHQVPVLLGTLTSNVHDQPPFNDTFQPATDTAAWWALYRQTLTAPAAQQDSLFGELFRLDTLPASAHYRFGRFAERTGRLDTAYRHLYLAKDYDGLRFRASEDLNRVLRQLAQKPGVRLVPVKEAFEQQSPNRLPGTNLFLEHLHPNLKGYFLLAKSFYRTILRSKRIPGTPRKLPPDSLLWQELGITDFDREAGNIRIRVLTSGWPFRKSTVGTLDRLNLKPETYVQQLALDYWHKKITWEKAHVLLAEHYLKTKQWKRAAAEFRALIVFTPFNPSPYQHLVRILVEHGRYAEAIPYLKTLIRLSPDLFAYRTLGKIYLQQGYPEKAIPNFRQALNIYAADEESLFYLAAAYFQIGQLENARMFLQRLQRVAPDYPGLPRLEAMVNKKQAG